MKGNGRRGLEVGERVELIEERRSGSIYDIDEGSRPPRFLVKLDDGERKWVELDEIQDPKRHELD